MSSGGSARVVVIALGANLGIALAKFAGAAVSGSAALLAEAIHSVVDTGNQVLLLVGQRAARRQPSESHPLGYGREAFFWSFLVAVLLFSLGGLFAVYEGVHKLHARQPLEHPALALAILLVSLALESYSFRACLREVRAQNRFASLWEWFRKAAAVDLMVVFMEDIAALLGLGAATAALALSWATGDPSWDALGSIVVGLVLVAVAALLAMEIKSLLVGEAPSRDYRSYVESLVASELPGGRVLRLLAIHTGAQEVLLSYKVHPGSVREVDALIAATNRIEAAVKARFPEVRWQFVEPDCEA
ncbi:MAG: cation diffusion facilitator family transporter [Elusimicrobia bacterium]|nr:cation diffusion facilitator family transporter [Elusimicrobiota bacterium]